MLQVRGLLLFHGQSGYLSILDVFPHVLNWDASEIRERLVEKPVATLLARTQALEIARSRRLGSRPGLYKRVSVRVRARERAV